MSLYAFPLPSSYVFTALACAQGRRRRAYEPTVGQKERRVGCDAAGRGRQDARHGQVNPRATTSWTSARRRHRDHRRQARCHRVGIEYNPTWSSCRSETPRRRRVAPRDLHEGGPVRDDFSQATVITMFCCGPHIKLRPKISRSSRHAHVSNSFTMGTGRRTKPPSSTRRRVQQHPGAPRSSGSCPRARGKHKVAQGEVTFKQQFQKVSGTMATEEDPRAPGR